MAPTFIKSILYINSLLKVPHQFVSVKTLLKLIQEAEDAAEKSIIFSASWRAIMAANGYVYDRPTSGNYVQNCYDIKNSKYLNRMNEKGKKLGNLLNM